MSVLDVAVRLVYIAAAACFVWGLHEMNSPATARRGNLLSVAGMLAAVLATVAVLVGESGVRSAGWVVLVAGAAVGGVVGLVAALLAVHELVAGTATTEGAVTGALDVLIGAVTFTGSLVAAGKLQGIVPGRPVVFPGARVVNVVLLLAGLYAGGWLVVNPAAWLPLLVLGVAALGFGVTMVLPIGGADMPVVISLLNAFTGTAVAMAGFVIENTMLITAGALVGASGSILTKLMADAMNRSIPAIVVGGFGTGDSAAAVTAGDTHVREVTAEDVAIQLAYASKVIVVPGYGLAAAQAQHQVADLAAQLEQRGVDVSYAIHPVAGRMPGHMNVLLAEANVPYPQLKDLEEVNPEFPHADVALVVGANDVTNPAARRPGNAVSGMPILDVDKANSVVVIKRSLGHGYAGIDNELYTDPRTGMLFADAKTALTRLTAAVKDLVG